jgi:hypothetical protein
MAQHLGIERLLAAEFRLVRARATMSRTVAASKPRAANSSLAASSSRRRTSCSSLPGGRSAGAWLPASMRRSVMWIVLAFPILNTCNKQM